MTTLASDVSEIRLRTPKLNGSRDLNTSLSRVVGSLD